ncbi:hypothetical protein EB093_08590, partial [bacterium]|nr:hypothetical protein [bacterium]
MSLMKRILSVVIGAWLATAVCQAGEPYMIPVADSLVFMVHGIDSNRYTWDKPLGDGTFELKAGDRNKWRSYLMGDLMVPADRIKPYSFS